MLSLTVYLIDFLVFNKRTLLELQFIAQTQLTFRLKRGLNIHKRALSLSFKMTLVDMHVRCSRLYNKLQSILVSTWTSGIFFF